MKKLVMFDLDGTLMDTSPGIISCYNQTAAHFGCTAAEKPSFVGIIGGPLKGGFVQLYGMDDSTADQAVVHYRKLYQQQGMFQYEVYPGIANLLGQLAAQNIHTAVATLKLEKFAKIMLAEAGLVFSPGAIFGEDGTGLSKAHLLELAMAHTKTTPDQAALVGDSKYDALGAQTVGCDFVAVTYGWGFTCADDAAKHYHSSIVATADEIMPILLQ